MSWTWDPTLYAGSAPHYAVGRVPYPDGLASALVSALPLDGRQRLLDVGCGPGSLTLLLAPHVAEAIGVDADADMLAEAARLGASLPNVRWVRLRAEELPGDLPPVDVVAFAQSFHWMDQPRVAAVVRGMLRPGDAVVHVGATTHEGIHPDGDLPFPRPPRDVVAQLIERYLGPVRRAGQGVLPAGTSGGEDDVFRAAGFSGPERIEVPGRVVERSVEEVASSIYSLSSSAPHLFGDRLADFDADLRALLTEASADGRFSEQMRSITLSIWR
jgi:SAM-dependent methyltransferase